MESNSTRSELRASIAAAARIACGCAVLATLLNSGIAHAVDGVPARQAALESAAQGRANASDHFDTPVDDAVRVIVRAFETAAITSEVNARITYLPPREGDAFHKGDVLVEFDCRRTQAEHDAAEATMKELQAGYQSQLKLLEYKSTGTVAVEQALHQFEKAKAELRLYQVRLESCRIIAPFDGLVTEKAAQVFEVAQPNQPLIKILNQKKLELVMMVPSAWLPQIAGVTFPVKIDETGEVHQARVLQSTGLIDPVSQTSRVIAELVDPALNVFPGMSGTADLVRARAEQ